MRNPFSFEHADAWSTSFADVETLNAKVSNLVLEAVDNVRRAAPLGPEQLRSACLLALGPAGTGKTHLFRRLRRKCGPRAGFVYLRPHIGVEPTPRQVLATTIDALRRPASGTTGAQLDVLVGSLLGKMEQGKAGWPHVALQRHRDSTEAEQEEVFARTIDAVEQRYPGIFSPYLEQLLRGAFAAPVDRRAALSWLSGRDPSPGQAERLGVAGGIPDTEVIGSLTTLAIVAAFGSPLVLVFDQLENLVDGDDTSRVTAYGNLISELHDSVHGLVIVQMGLDDEWKRRIRPVLASSQASRAEVRVVNLDLPGPDEREQLVRAWVEQLDNDETHPFPWPFTPQQLDEWRHAPGMTPRGLMITCRQAYEAGPDPATESSVADSLDKNVPPGTQLAMGEEETTGQLERLWEAHLAMAHHELQEVAAEDRGLDTDRLSAALRVLLRNLGANTNTRRKGQAVVLQVDTGHPEQPAVISQASHPRAAAAALQHAKTLATSGKPALLVRQQSIDFPPTWKTVAKYAQELTDAGGRVMLLDQEETARLIALHDFVAAAQSQDLAGLDGKPIQPGDAQRWLEAGTGFRQWPIVAKLAGSEPDVSEPDSEVEHVATNGGGTDSQPAIQRNVPSASPPVDDGAQLTMILDRLTVASIDRLTRELAHEGLKTSPIEVADKLRAEGEAVGWVGRSIVYSKQGLA